MEKGDNSYKALICDVCPHHCRLGEGQTGRCGARKNVRGELLCDNYGKVTSLMLDPIEKKPLKRFHPGSRILSIGSYGCNLSCPFCQNHEISMPKPGREPGYGVVLPEEIKDFALKYISEGNIGVAFTYNEPLIGYEFVRDTAKLVHEAGLKNVVVTNGCVELRILEEILPYIDAMNIDLKGFTEGYYKMVGGDLETVKGFIEKAVLGCHVELTTLIVPDENDSEEDMDREARWIASLSRDIPLHITRFFPRYKMKDKMPTEPESIYRLKEIAERHLKYVYTGNI